MIHTSQHSPRVLLLALLLSALCFGVTGLASTHPDEKMKPEEVVAKHLASIGKPEDIAASKTRVITGQNNTKLKIAGTIREVSGPAQFASDGQKVLLTMVFNSDNYPYEKIAWDGDRLTVANLPRGGRSALTNFFVTQDLIFKHGLVGGALSSAWPLGSLDPEKGKLSYSGTDKIDGRPVHRLKYQPRRGDLKVNLYFDAETFQHLRSEYEYTISPKMGPRPSSSMGGPNSTSQTLSRYKLTEEFSNFKTVGKVTLPQSYKLQIVVEAQPQTLDYTIEFNQFAFDQTIEASAFNVSSPTDGN